MTYQLPADARVTVKAGFPNFGNCSGCTGPGQAVKMTEAGAHVAWHAAEGAQASPPPPPDPAPSDPWADAEALYDGQPAGWRPPRLGVKPTPELVGAFSDLVRSNPRRVIDGAYTLKADEVLPWGTLVTGKLYGPHGSAARGCVLEQGIEGPSTPGPGIALGYCDLGHGRRSGSVLNITKGAYTLDRCLNYGGVDLVHASIGGRNEHRDGYAHSCRYIDHDPGQSNGPSHNDVGQAVHPQGQVVLDNYVCEAWSFHGDTESVTRWPESNPHRGDKTGIISPDHGYQTSGFLSGDGQGPGTYLELTDVDLTGNYNQALIWQGKAKFTRVRVASDTGVVKYRPRVLFGATIGAPGVTALPTDANGMLPAA